jgi:uncharacterized membrane protein
LFSSSLFFSAAEREIVDPFREQISIRDDFELPPNPDLGTCCLSLLLPLLLNLLSLLVWVFGGLGCVLFPLIAGFFAVVGFCWVSLSQ